MLQILAIGVAGGIGAALRAWLDARLAPASSSGVPRSTILINLTGALLIGVAAGLGSGLVPSEWMRVVMVGLLGGYTTFSTAAVQTAEMLLAGQWRKASVYGIGLGAGAAALAAVGFWIGSAAA